MLEKGEYVDLNYTQNLGFSKDVVKSLINTYLDQCTGFLVLFNSFLNNRDWLQLSALAHKAKGSVSYFGMNRLVNLLKKIELLAEAYMFIKLEEKIIDNQQLSQEEIKIFGRLQSNELIKKILMTSLNFSI